MTRSKRYPAEVRERATQMVFDHRASYESQWSAIRDIAGKIGGLPETLRGWVRQAERDRGLTPGPSSSDLAEIKELRREVKELRQANEILKAASAFLRGSSTRGHRSDDRLHRPPQGTLRSRADLQDTAVRFVDLLRMSGKKREPVIARPSPMSPEEGFRILSEFDAERAELFLARAVILVEGLTEKLALPFVFEALGENADRAGISIVECGGKSNIILFARVCKAAGVPFIAVYDRDARPGQRPSASNRQLASAIKRLTGKNHSFELAPDFEAVSRVEKRGKGKPERAWRSFSRLSREQMPQVLLRIAELAIELSRGLPESRELSDVPSVAELLDEPAGGEVPTPPSLT